MSLTDREQKKIDALLAEYQACHRNRNHYDSVRWTIGSIFIATSLALFGISFVKEVRGSFIEVNLITIFSILLMLIWYAYSQHVDPYVMASIKRFHEIELELDDMRFDVGLHKSIAEIKQRWKGVHITLCLFLTMFTAWISRILLSWLEHGAAVGVYGIIPVTIYLALMMLVLVNHIKELNSTNWGNEIAELLRERGKKNRASARKL